MVPESVPMEVACTPDIFEPSPINAFAVTVPATVSSPETETSPDTVRLSPMVTSEVPCPIFIATPFVPVATCNVPVLFNMWELVPS